jgi:hypothetical protein
MCGASGDVAHAAIALLNVPSDQLQAANAISEEMAVSAASHQWRALVQAVFVELHSRIRFGDA